MPDVELRRYEIAAGEMDAFVEHWRRLMPIREKFGFTVLFAFADRDSNEFVWAVRHDGDFAAADQAYNAAPEHADVVKDLRPRLGGHRSSMVDVIVAPAGHGP